jgi:TIR domain
MRTGEGIEAWRYWAFISYSHADATFAKRLQRALETYRIPRALVGRITRGERIPRTLSPIFLDREDLRVGPDLGGVIKEHLESSRYLVVVCSTAAAQSAWVNREIRHFQSLGRADRILCVISNRTTSALEDVNAARGDWLPIALHSGTQNVGDLAGFPAEPAAADARPQKDGWKNALLKVVAGILEVDFDRLRQRERRRQAARRIRQAALAIAAAFAAVVAYVLLSDLGAPLPAAAHIQQQLDHANFFLSRRVYPAAAVQQKAAQLRAILSRELVRRWREREWEAPLLDPSDPSKEYLDVWLAAQSASGALRNPARRPTSQLPTELTEVFDAAFVPGVPLYVGRKLYGWRTGRYLPEGRQQALAATTAVGVDLWMAAGVAIVMAQADVLTVARQKAFRSYAELVQQSAGKYYSADGGWNFFPEQIRPAEHSTYASVLALLALMETRAAGLPWGGSVARRDEMLTATVNWLIAHFERSGNAAGWREAPADPSLVDGLTLQAYAELLRAEAQVGTHLPDAIYDAIRRRVVVLLREGLIARYRSGRIRVSIAGRIGSR